MNIEDKAKNLEAYRLFEGQDSDCKYLTDKIVKTRKEHYCNECGDKIKISEQAKCVKLVEDSIPEAYYYHIECAAKIYDEFNSDD